MLRFWTSHIEPLLRIVRPYRIMEIGLRERETARRILEFGRNHRIKVDIVNPELIRREKSELGRFAGYATFFDGDSLEAIAGARGADVVVIDGDHNWRTVYQEFSALFERSRTRNAPAPIVVFSGAAWPHARRDSYHAPERIEEEFRQPYAYRSLVPGQLELGEGGLDGHLANAIREGGPRNGVLTAVEDFIAEWPEEIELRVLPFFGGLGICVPRARMTQEIADLLDRFFSSAGLLEAIKALEEHNNDLAIQLRRERIDFVKRSEALERARLVLGDHLARIRELETKLGPGEEADPSAAPKQ